MKIIGAGLPRTATLSQKIGLERLGFAPCYHMVEVLADLSRASAWADALDGKADWARIFEGYEATVDWPATFFLDELCETYPDAKVVLSERDADAWARSFYDTVWAVLFGDSLMHDLSLARYRIDPDWKRYTDFMREVLERSGLRPLAEGGVEGGGLQRWMHEWNAHVRETVPAGRLLVWHPADGFAPLAAFLGVAAPDEDFPRVNDAAHFADLVVGSSVEAIHGWYVAQEHPSH